MDETKLREAFLWSSASHKKEQISEIVFCFDEFLKEIITKNLFKEKNDSFITAIDIFSFAIPSHLAYPVMEKANVETYYQLGEYLLKIKPDYSEMLNHFIYSYLNLFRLPQFLTKIRNERRWDDLIDKLIVASNFTFSRLFEQRVNDYQKKNLLRVLKGKREISYSWEETDQIIKKYSSNLKSLLESIGQPDGYVSFLLENSPEMAFFDLGCLYSGIINIMIPANSVAKHAGMILDETKSPVIIVDDEKQLAKIKTIKNDVKSLKKVILLEGTSAEEYVISFEEFLKSAPEKEIKRNLQKEKNINVLDTATIMYTSGTTGEPKGIVFSYHNIVYKRFCRAMAIPEIGENDRFLCYLPLYHTFGRYLELTGAVFWASEYIFMENPSVETMVASMQLVKPTVFISIPKKWLQIYEYISHRVDIEFGEENDIINKIKEVTGGELKRGLSAAGFLSPEIFQFFQRYGIELMSGFGMTEATGGITMTTPGNYIQNSLGGPLPGIKIKVAEDGELLIKGPYVMKGYFDQLYEETFDADGWFPTGDIMKIDEFGYIEIIDRKKEIYKNIKGETIAPQKIENYFLDFDFVKQVFLVGDHRPYNTVLIYPDYESNQAHLAGMDTSQQREYFASVVVTVNNFLAPFERILNFRIIDRPFSLEAGELTPKGTYKRRNIEKNFNSVIEEMYLKEYIELAVDEYDVRIPNWFLREVGSLSRDIAVKYNSLCIPKLDLQLTIRLVDKEKKIFRIGDFNYVISSDYIDLQTFLTNPIYWLGNKELLDFTNDMIFQWYRQSKKDPRISFHSINLVRETDHDLIKKLNFLIVSNEKSLAGLHIAVLIMHHCDEASAIIAARYLELILRDNTLPVYKYVIDIIQTPNLTECFMVRREMLKVALKAVSEIGLVKLLKIYLSYDHKILDEIIIEQIVNLKDNQDTFDAIKTVVESEIRDAGNIVVNEGSLIYNLFQLVEWFGIFHPAKYEAVRIFLVKYQVEHDLKNIVKIATITRTNIREGFRKWLGVNQTIAVDIETGEEYTWDDVMIFEEGIDTEDKERIRNALTYTAVIRESIFLFSKGTLIRLNNILPGGVYISFYNGNSYKTVYRISVQTRLQGSFDLILNLNQNYDKQIIRDKINWLILAGSRNYVQEMVEDFGGYWEEYDLWSQKFIPGMTVDKFFRSEYRKNEEASNKRMYNLWPFFVWNASAAYMNFWKLTGKSLKISDATPGNILIPLHDYQTGTRFVSFAEMTKVESLKDLFLNLYFKFIEPCEKKYSHIRIKGIWNFIFSGVINTFGEKAGLEILYQFNNELEKTDNEDFYREIKDTNNNFIEYVKTKGFIPKQSYFAIKRFHRWFLLNQNASLNAQAQMLAELFETYNLYELEKAFPETRTKFFVETVFEKSNEKLKLMLYELVQKQKNSIVANEEFLSEISLIQSECEISERESFFLIRLSYPHIKPTDTAVLIKPKAEGFQSANLVVNFEDSDGAEYRIRKPISPREISKLHQLFTESNLIIQFRPEHQFLVAISERGYIIGGLYYFIVDSHVVHIEKIVVANKYRKKGISEKLMSEFFNRMKDEHFDTITTGFFRPEYFYRFGFKIEKKYSGLVKNLNN
ncbi:MAG: GNAT family N-acetyltransferase [Ignavibacteria bacterium]|nr:GNAT family N-acetyltransferase [Ignavibacteria bacterium]